MKTLVTVSLVERDGIKQLDWKTDQSEIADIDRLISVLGQFRATLEPPVKQSDPEVGEFVESVDDPRWAAGPTLDEQLLLMIRHHGFGWLGFQFPQQSEEQLLNLLLSRKSEEPGPAGSAH